ncbi:MAG: DegT/DnrJ/EryC1/StrS aminotransferase family protein [Clostridiales Family XIII bacterium]|jgi:dTDP-4-amino-4,6-dideoxygalactose transaminase|nr:DegT/DnrJ/EryC1/StrS aminotransferase family protein [Clostridiales Family XIII bacterium]
MNKIGVGYASVTPLEKKYVNEALDSDRLSPSRYVHQFERSFSAKHNKRYGVMCNSGTSAIHIALEALKEIDGWDEGTEVLVPALTFISSSNAVLHAGLKPVFVDVDPMTYNMDPRQIGQHITGKARCILPVHAFGLPCEMDLIAVIAQKNKLRIVEDCSDAHFALYKGRTVGSWGDLSAFSTYVAHTIMTGIGGIAITDGEHCAEILRSLIAHGRSCTCEVCTASDPNQVCRKRSDNEMDRRFLFERMGYSYRVGELEGALGCAQLERAGEIMSARRRNAGRLTELLSPLQDVLQLPIYGSDYGHTFMMYPILIKSGKFTRKELTDFLEMKNIETRPMFPLLNQPIYRKMYGDIEKHYPNAAMIARNGFYVGCHHGLDEEEMAYIAATVKDAVEGFMR